jgi:DUF3048 family protein
MRVFVLLVVLLVVVACSQPRPIGPPERGTTVGTAAKTAIWPLRGTPAPSDDATRTRPLVVKIANDPAARPQAGIAGADLVLEIIVEGGLTRYALVFQSRDPERVGPVRSARQSDLNYLPALRAIVAHVGASQEVTKLVRDAAKGGDFIDIDELEHADAFERIAQRQAPYNAYTSGKKIRTAAGAAGAEKVDVPSFAFGAVGTGVDAPSLVVPYVGAQRVEYEYDAAGSAYRRTQGGQATIDEDGKKEVRPDNVVVVKTDVTEIAGTADSAGAPSVDYRATGSGPVVVLRDGKRFDGTWSRQGNGLYVFRDATGSAILLKPGLTWLHIVPLTFDL